MEFSRDNLLIKLVRWLPFSRSCLDKVRSESVTLKNAFVLISFLFRERVWFVVKRASFFFSNKCSSTLVKRNTEVIQLRKISLLSLSYIKTIENLYKEFVRDAVVQPIPI